MLSRFELFALDPAVHAAADASRLIYASVKSSLNLSHVLRCLASLRHTLYSSMNMPILCTSMYVVLTTWSLVNSVCACATYSTTSSIFSNRVSIVMLISYSTSILSLLFVRPGSLMMV